MSKDSSKSTEGGVQNQQPKGTSNAFSLLISKVVEKIKNAVTFVVLFTLGTVLLSFSLFLWAANDACENVQESTIVPLGRIAIVYQCPAEAVAPMPNVAKPAKLEF